MEKNYALVTGASSGIGFQYARLLAKRGYKLLIVSNEEAIHEKADAIRAEFGAEVVALVRDLGQQSAAKELYDYCQEHAMQVDVLVNNAGVYHDRDILDDSVGFTNLILNLHAYTPAMLCYYFGQDMRERHEGYILNMCSVTGSMAIQRLGTYSSTKSFLQNFTRSLHIELKQHGVKVTAVRPGAVDTGLYNINETITKFGRWIGFIVSPEYLAKRGLRAMFQGRWRVTVPFVWGTLLVWVVAILPTCVLRLIRRVGVF